MQRVGWSFLVALVACATGGPGDAEAVRVGTDRAGLARHVRFTDVPDVFGEVRWAARPRGRPGLGPTDLELVALLGVDAGGWDGVAAALGAPEGAGSLDVPAPLLAALDLGPGPVRGEAWPCAAFENVRWRCVGAVRVPGGLLVWMASR